MDCFVMLPEVQRAIHPDDTLSQLLDTVAACPEFARTTSIPSSAPGCRHQARLLTPSHFLQHRAHHPLDHTLDRSAVDWAAIDWESMDWSDPDRSGQARSGVDLSSAGGRPPILVAPLSRSSTDGGQRQRRQPPVPPPLPFYDAESFTPPSSEDRMTTMWDLGEMRGAAERGTSLHFVPEPVYIPRDHKRYGNVPLRDPYAESLGSDRIRLLRLLPEGFVGDDDGSISGSGKLGEDVKGEESDKETDGNEKILACVIESFEVRKLPRYVALSYCWGEDRDGEEGPRAVVQCGGLVRQKVRANLAGLLTRLRGLEFIEWLWVDALCINQADDKELSLQIPLMKDIFTNSIMTLGWLGEEDASPDTPSMSSLWHHSQTVQDIYTAAVRGHIRIDGQSPTISSLSRSSTSVSTTNSTITSPFSNRSNRQHQQQALSWPPDTYWTALSRIFNNRYFRRVWTLQETVLPDRLFLLSGRLLLDWEAVHLIAGCCTLLGSMSFFASGTAARRSAEKASVTLGHLGELRLLFHSDYPREGLIYVSSVIQHSQSRAATKAGDHVFGILGFLNASAVEKMTVDVRRAPERIFAEFTAVLFGYHGPAMCDQLRRAGLRLDDDDATGRDMANRDGGNTVRHGGGETLQKKLPSWCIDFTRPSDTESLRTISDSTYKVSGGPTFHVQQNVRIDLDKGRLTVRGWYLTTVHSVVHLKHEAKCSDVDLGMTVVQALDEMMAQTCNVRQEGDDPSTPVPTPSVKGKPERMEIARLVKEAIATTISAECRLARPAPNVPRRPRIEEFEDWCRNMQAHLQGEPQSAIGEDMAGLDLHDEKPSEANADANNGEVDAGIAVTPPAAMNSFGQGVVRACRNRSFFTTTLLIEAGKPPDSMFSTEESSSSSSSSSSSKDQSSDSVTSSRLIRTPGLGPRNLRPGDKLCAIFGSHTILVLRPLPNGERVAAERRSEIAPSEGTDGDDMPEQKYRLLGECFCHGLNFGSLKDFAVRQELQVQDFIIV